MLMRPQASRNHTRFARFPDIGDLEWLHASYETQEFSPHFHEGHVIGVIEKGQLGFDYRGERLVASAGEINIADPGEVHNGFSVSRKGWQYRMFYLKAGQLDRICNEVCGRPRAMPFFRKGVIRDRCLAGQVRALHRTFENPEVSVLEKESRFHTLVSRFILKHAVETITPVSPGTERKAVSRIKSYIREYYETGITLSDLSRVAGMSRYYLLRVFAKTTGMTPHAYLNVVRASRARELLGNRVPIADTAYSTGFFDQSHLNRVFKKIYGITPGQFCRGV